MLLTKKPPPASSPPGLNRNALAHRWLTIGVRWMTARYASTFCHADIEELVDDAIIDTLDKLAGRPGIREPDALFFSTLRGRISNRLRDDRRRAPRQGLLERMLKGAFHDGRRDQTGSDVQQALDRLPERERDLLTLRFVLEMSIEETAALLGISEKKCRNLEASAKDRFKKRYPREVSS